MERKGFRTTHWSIVLRATEPKADEREALEALCRTYWFPLYAFVRRQGRTHEEAQDLVQGFFARFVEKRDWRVGPERGRFRSFLLAAMRNFLANERDRENASKRGGGAATFSIDADADRRYAGEDADRATPEKLYERRFALELLDDAMRRLALEQRATGAARFERLKPFLAGIPDEVPYARLAAELATSEGAVRVAVHRLRKRYGELLRRAVGDLVDDPGEIQAEIQALMDALES